MVQKGARLQLLLDRRLALLASLSALGAEAHRLQQAIAATEMERLRVELAMAHGDAGEGLVRDLQQVEESAEAIRSAREACDDRIAAAERDVEEIDRRIAAENGAAREERDP